LTPVFFARAYAIQGDTANAEAAYQEFLTLWKDSDADTQERRKTKVVRKGVLVRLRKLLISVNRESQRQIVQKVQIMNHHIAWIGEIAQEVYQTPGSGFSEDVYDRAMQIGLRLAGIPVDSSSAYKEHYCSTTVRFPPGEADHQERLPPSDMVRERRCAFNCSLKPVN
jgi:hypothetical protein